MTHRSHELGPGQHYLHPEVGGHKRRALVHVPPACAGPAPCPAVLMLHGAGGTARWTLNETGWADTADREGFVAVFPEGLPVELHRPAHLLQNPLVWNDGSPRFAARGVDDVAFLDRVLGELTARTAVDPRRAYLTGFSNGAGMAFRLGLERGDRFAALAPVAGYCRVPLRRLDPPVPTLYLVGTADPLVPLRGGFTVSPWGWKSQRPPLEEELGRWAAALGLPVAPSGRRQEDGVRILTFGEANDRAGLTAYFIEGQGHHWPGGHGKLDSSLFGPRSPRLEANPVIWEFFRAHSLPET